MHLSKYTKTKKKRKLSQIITKLKHDFSILLDFSNINFSHTIYKKCN